MGHYLERSAAARGKEALAQDRLAIGHPPKLAQQFKTNKPCGIDGEYCRVAEGKQPTREGFRAGRAA